MRTRVVVARRSFRKCACARADPQRGGDVRTIARRQLVRGLTATGRDRRVRAVREQQLDDRDVAGRHRFVQRCPPLAALVDAPWIVIDQLAHSIDQAEVRGLSHVGVRPALDEQPDEVAMAVLHRPPRGRRVEPDVATVRIGSTVEQPAHDLGVTVVRRPMQPRRAEIPLRVDVGVVIEQELRDRQLAG